MNAIRKYWDSVYVYVLLLVPGFCMCAGIFWSICKALGLYPHLSWWSILLFDFSQFLYLTIALLIIYKNKKDKSYIPRHLSAVKGFIVTALFVQYNFILYLFPSRHVWGCTFLFFAIIVFLFDSRLMILNILSYTFSLLTAHILKPEQFLPLEDDNLSEVIAFRSVIFALTALCIIFIVYFVEKFLLQAQESDEENLLLMEKQLEYFKNMDLMDLELRKFRHDSKNHFLCIQSLFLSGKTEEAQHYFEELQQSFSFDRTLYFSGNDVVDAILHHELPHHCKKEITVTIYGGLPEITTVSSMDLCTLFSNLLSNAIVAANQCTSLPEPQLTIQFSGGKKYFSICITNSIPPDTQKPVSAKKDRNHGHGLKKIRQILERYNGTMTQSATHQLFTVTIYLPV